MEVMNTIKEYKQEVGESKIEVTVSDSEYKNCINIKIGNGNFIDIDAIELKKAIENAQNI